MKTRIKVPSNIIYELDNTGSIKAMSLLDYLITLENVKILKDNLPLSLSNILVNNRRVEAARYDMLLNEIEFELSNNERWICPKCNRECYEYPALSRKDNETEICPRCGIKEAMEDFINE